MLGYEEGIFILAFYSHSNMFWPTEHYVSSEQEEMSHRPHMNLAALQDLVIRISAGLFRCGID